MTKTDSTISKQLLSRLTHHVRNPFNGIIGFTDLLNSHYANLSEADKKNYIKIVHLLSKKALLRSENLAWWLKFYTDNLQPVTQKIDVVDLLQEEVRYFATELNKQNIDLLEDYIDNSMIDSDKVMIQSIIKNIILNIIEFTPEGDEATIKSIKQGGELQLIFTNKFTETPSEETMEFLNQLNEQPQFDKMPGNPGLWTIHTLCNLLNIGLSITLKNNLAEVKLSLPHN
ncbi:MAG: hypothetical protein LC096_09170 [Bacteroidia bacterium]|nr:hypothetical protein [Bacteroidia bacterium]